MKVKKGRFDVLINSCMFTYSGIISVATLTRAFLPPKFVIEKDKLYFFGEDEEILKFILTKKKLRRKKNERVTN